MIDRDKIPKSLVQLELIVFLSSEKSYPLAPETFIQYSHKLIHILRLIKITTICISIFTYGMQFLHDSIPMADLLHKLFASHQNTFI